MLVFVVEIPLRKDSYHLSIWICANDEFRVGARVAHPPYADFFWHIGHIQLLLSPSNGHWH